MQGLERKCQNMQEDIDEFMEKFGILQIKGLLNPLVINEKIMFQNDYVKKLNVVGIYLSNKSDELVWDWKNSNGSLIVKVFYDILIDKSNYSVPNGGIRSCGNGYFHKELDVSCDSIWRIKFSPGIIF